MTRRRHIIAAIICLMIFFAWAIPSQHLYHLVLAGAGHLAEQILGFFNYSQRPGWYIALATTFAALCAIGPSLIGACFIWYRQVTPAGFRAALRNTRINRRSPRSWLLGATTRIALATLIASVTFATLMLFAEYPIRSLCIDLGEFLGGRDYSSVYGSLHGGRFLTVSVYGGPFFGDAWQDHLGNTLAQHGPHTLISLVSATLGLTIFALLHRQAVRRDCPPYICPICGYDLSASSPNLPCSECGKTSTSPRPRSPVPN